MLPAPESGNIQSPSPELWSKAGQIWTDPAIYLAESNQIRMSLARIRPNPTKPARQNPATATESCRISATVA